MINKSIITVSDYIEVYPQAVREKLEQIRSIIKKAAPDSTELISYGMPAFRMKDILVYFAAHTNHLGFYPMPSAITKFKKELAIYKHSKGAIRFTYDKALPVELIEKITKFRVAENEAKMIYKTDQ
mgnify:CR=1 FL=1